MIFLCLASRCTCFSIVTFFPARRFIYLACTAKGLRNSNVNQSVVHSFFVRHVWEWHEAAIWHDALISICIQIVLVWGVVDFVFLNWRNCALPDLCSSMVFYSEFSCTCITYYVYFAVLHRFWNQNSTILEHPLIPLLIFATRCRCQYL